MSLHYDLLSQSKYLLNREPRRPRQASLRRAISTAYYAMFHLLIYESCRILVKDDQVVGMLARSFNHGEMAKVSKMFAAGNLPRKLNPMQATFADPNRLQVFNRLKEIAKTFVDLQQSRLEADYNLRKQFSRSEARRLVEAAEKAFDDWKLVRNDDLARIYLSSFLLLDRWNGER